MVMAQEQPQRGQRGGGRGFGGGGGFGARDILSIITNEAVQKDLAVDADSVAKLKKVSDDAGADSRKEMEALPRPAGGNENLSDEERRKRGAEFMAKFAEIRSKMLAKYTPQLKEILNETQFTRLKQINWQANLNGALTDPEVIKAIDLTKEQQDKIAAIGKEYDEKQRALFTRGQGGAGGGQEAQTKREELSKERTTKTTEVLNADQKAKFATLKGKEFDVSKLRGGFGGRAGGGGTGTRPATEDKKAE